MGWLLVLAALRALLNQWRPLPDRGRDPLDLGEAIALLAYRGRGLRPPT